MYMKCKLCRLISMTTVQVKTLLFLRCGAIWSNWILPQLAHVAGVRKGRGRELGRETMLSHTQIPPSPSPFNACHTGYISANTEKPSLFKAPLQSLRPESCNAPCVTRAQVAAKDYSTEMKNIRMCRGYFQVVPSLCFKASLSVKLLMWFSCK